MSEQTPEPAIARAAQPSTRHHVSVGQSIVRGALAMLSVQPVTWAASLLTAVAVPRLLGADTFGQVTIAFTISSLAAMVSGLGISDYLVRRVAQRPHTHARDLGIALFVQMTTAVVCALIVGVIGPLLTSSVLDERLLWAALVPLLGAPVQTVLLASLRGREQHAKYAWFNAAGVVLSAVGGVAILAAGGGVVASVTIGSSLPIAFMLIAWRFSGVRPGILLDWSMLLDIREFIRGGFPFLTWQLTLAAYGQVDKLLMGAFVPAFEVGWYAAAYRIIGVVVFIPTLVAAPLFPALSRGASDPIALRRAIAQTIKLLLFLMVGLGAGTIVVAPEVPHLLGWPSDFEQAVPLMMVLALHEPLVAIDMVLGVVLMAIHREARWISVGVAATAFNLAANLVAIPFFEHSAGNGAIGASVVTVLTEILMFFGAALLIPKDLLDTKLIWQGVRLAVAGVLAIVVGSALLPFALLIAAPAAAVTYVAVVAVMRVVTMEDLQPLRARFSALGRSQ